MTKSPALSILASLSQASNLPPNKPPETDETKPRPWQAPQLVAQSDIDLPLELTAMPETEAEILTREDRIREQLLLYSPTDCIGDKLSCLLEALQEELDGLENAEEFCEY